LPWWSAGYLHVGGALIPTTMRRIVTRGGTTLVGRMTVHGSAWRIVRGGHLRPLFATRSAYVRPLVSANGRNVAWVRSQTLRRIDRYRSVALFTITAYDVWSGQRVASTQLRSRTQCCDQGGVLGVLAVANDGAVLVHRNDDLSWVWRPGQALIRLQASAQARLRSVVGGGQWPGGVTWLVTDDGAGPAAYGRVDPSGALVRLGRVPQAFDGLWSQDGTSYVFQPFSKGSDYPPVVWTRAGRVRLQVRHLARIIGWESARSVIVSVAPRGHHPPARVAILVRCDAHTGACEQAGAALHGATLPDYLS
jgi:hypothetical protein